MIQEVMTVHKALCELKMLDKRINESIMSAEFCRANKHSNVKIDGGTIAEYEAAAVSKYQSTMDMIVRRDAIKRAVVASNAATEVTIGGNRYTVADAVELRRHGLSYRRTLLQAMTLQLKRVRSTSEQKNGEELTRAADKMVEVYYGRQTDVKAITEEMKATREKFIEDNTYELLDPIRIENRIRELDKEITAFETEVDSALSVSNAVTEITVSYETTGVPN
mgnify:FL=1